MTGQRRHESPEVGAAAFRMIRALVRRAAEGDTEALEQLAKVERMAAAGTTVALHQAHQAAGYSYTELADVTGTTRQAARQRVERLDRVPLAFREFLSRGLSEPSRPADGAARVDVARDL